MNDVASTSLVTVRRPQTMLPYAFKQALSDLSAMRLVDVSLVTGDHAVVERLEPSDKSLPVWERVGEETEVPHGAVRDDESREVDSNDQALNVEAAPAAEKTPRELGRAKKRDVALCVADAQAGARLIHARKVQSPGPRTRKRVVMRAPREGSKTNRGGQHACRPRKERVVMRDSFVAAIVGGILKGLGQ